MGPTEDVLMLVKVPLLLLVHQLANLAPIDQLCFSLSTAQT